MKRFIFNPQTGKKGALLDNVKLISWTNSYLTDSSVVIPKTYTDRDGDTTEWHLHNDAGVDQSTSYRHATQWVCMCQGLVTMGTDRSWQWIILPPLNYNKDEAVTFDPVAYTEDVMDCCSVVPDETLNQMLTAAQAFPDNKRVIWINAINDELDARITLQQHVDDANWADLMATYEAHR